MSASIKYTIEKDTATPALRRLAARLGGRAAHEAIGAALLSVIQGHFNRREQEPNKLGGPKQGFWGNLARGSSWSASEKEAVVTVPPPILQKLFGGTIRPVNSKALAFPISPTSYGKTAREMRLTGRTRYIPINRGDVLGIITSVEAKGVVGEALFLVVRKVTQAADPNALPSEGELVKSAMKAVEENAEPLLN